MGLYGDQLLPRFIDKVLGAGEFSKIRARTSAKLSGDVLEVGFGSGLNVPHYPATVTRVRAVDPATVGRKLAEPRVAASPVPVEYIGLNGEALPVDGESVDHVLITWTMCTIPDVGQALREMHRVLRAGGQLHFAEHGLAPDPKVAQWQHRLTPIQRRLFGGCHLNRPIDALVQQAGFTIDEMGTFYMSGPRPLGYMYQGVATKS